MSKWYSIKAMADDQSADVHIYDEIGMWGVTARDFVDQLKAVDATQINLHINSPGGSVIDGVAIQNALRQHSAKVTTYIDGLAGSIASIIALAGDEIQIADNAYVMIHNPASIVWGDAKDMLKEAEVLDKMANGLAGDYAKKMDIEVEEARALMDDETWYLGQEAVDAKFADSTYSGTQAVASFDAARFSAKAPQAAIRRFTKQPLGSNQESLTTESETMSEETITPDPASEVVDEVVAPVVDAVTEEASEQTIAEAVQEALIADRQRAAAVNAIGSKFGFEEEAEKWNASGKSIEEFRAHVLEKSPDDWRASLAVKNPSSQLQDDEADDAEAKAAVAKIKERRKARHGG